MVKIEYKYQYSGNKVTSHKKSIVTPHSGTVNLRFETLLVLANLWHCVAPEDTGRSNVDVYIRPRRLSRRTNV